MTLVTCDQFCSGVLNRTRHVVWQIECHANGHGRWQSHCAQFLDVTQNLLKNVADAIPHCSKDANTIPPFDNAVTLSSYIRYAPCFPCSTPGLLALLHLARTCTFSQSPFSRQKPQYMHQGQECLRSLLHTWPFV